VDKTYVLATPHFDRHTSYVALSRHRDNATVFYASDDFGGRRAGATAAEVRERFTETLSRARPKELAHDYLEREGLADAGLLSSLVVKDWERSRTAENSISLKAAPPQPNDLDARQQAAAERWAARQQNTPTLGQGSERTITHSPSQTPTYEKQRTPELKRDGPEDDLEL
jgi:hypothetical protein